MTSPQRVRLVTQSVDDLRQLYQKDLRKGRALVAGAYELGNREVCVLEVVHPANGDTLALDAEAVYSQREGALACVGLELVAFDGPAQARLLEFVERGSEPNAGIAIAQGGACTPQSKPTPPDSPRTEGLYDRIRGLSLRERETVARGGTLPERVALERCYGSSVWEGLLQNPQLTPAEVTRIAKNGGLSKPLVAVVVSNAGWLSRGEVQRALLSNPRVTGTHLEKVLRAMPRNDLLKIVQQSTYRGQVRSTAQKLIGATS